MERRVTAKIEEDCFDFLVLLEFICLMNKIEQKVHETHKTQK